ncbi:MAG: enoyl-CoA hydratase/isomerase family protein [Chloroflexota bacterium]|nr:enoyl-CoA hydratase/isomerase family protein [Dehalococcoidia bacterium]MDW8254917.1 enoyl-CoA hydratase/isomerase family protein [Chloroflexota bacterium]
MAWETILFERDGPLRLITLNRPRVLNAISRRMVEELAEAFAAVEADREARVLLITGAPRPDGRPCFSAGADLTEARAQPLSPKDDLVRRALESAWEVAQNDGPRHGSIYHTLFARLERMPIPSIAVVDGICTTGALELILACDLRVVADTAEISDWHLKNLGVIGGAGVTTRLPHLIGAARAKELMWTGAPLSGEEAYRIGLANRVFPSAELLPRAKDLARTIAARPPAALAASKAVINAALRHTPADGIRYSALWSALIALQRELEGGPPAE